MHSFCRQHLLSLSIIIKVPRVYRGPQGNSALAVTYIIDLRQQQNKKDLRSYGGIHISGCFILTNILTLEIDVSFFFFVRAHLLLKLNRVIVLISISNPIASCNLKWLLI